MHKPVLLNEVINYLNLREDLIYVDCTAGLGGHSYEILEKLNGKAKLILIDQDKTALDLSKERLKDYKNCYFFHSNFIHLREILNTLNIKEITGGVLLDLGVSSLQLDSIERGFSFKNGNKLDMRMDQSQEIDAYYVINHYNKEKLAKLIYEYGEERYSRRIADFICETRSKSGPIKTAEELSNLILKCYPKNKYFKIHPATRTFQAIRIEVNRELESLNKFLCFIPELLSEGSRLTVISFHSLEDRITKHFLKSRKDLKILTKKPVIASDIEIKDNNRARSAKLRAAEKV